MLSVNVCCLCEAFIKPMFVVVLYAGKCLNEAIS